MNKFLGYRCSLCRTEYSSDEITYTCPKDGGNLNVILDYQRILSKYSPQDIFNSDEFSVLKRMPDGGFERVTWDQALAEIAGKLTALRDRHGGEAFAFWSAEAGQGNHLGGAYGRQLLPAMRSRYAYNSLGQEKTGDFWVNGRLFGSQSCHTTEDVEHADYVLFVGCNPFQSHGIPNARDTLRELRKDPKRTMVVVDPRRTETARQAHIHLQLRPGTDAYLLAAMLSIIAIGAAEGRDDRGVAEALYGSSDS